MKDMYINKAKTTAVLMMLCAAPLLWAQDGKREQGMNREITLEREYDPSVKDASKVNILPEVKDPSVSKSAIDYAFMSVPADPKREIGIIEPGSYKTDMKYDGKRGYLNLGGGNYFNINGDAGYHILRTDRDKLNVFLTHRSTNGSLKYNNGYLMDETVKAKLNDNLAGLDFMHRFDKVSFKLNARYGYSAFNYYGLPAPSIYSTTGNDHTVVDDNQVNQQIFVETGVKSVDGASPVNYYADASFNRFSYKYNHDPVNVGPVENDFGFKFGFSLPLGGEHRFGAAAKLDYIGYSQPWEPKQFEDFFIGTVTPMYSMEGDFWNLHAGVNIMFNTGSKKNVFASPNVGVDVNIGSRTVLYANAGGNIKSNGLYDLSRENRYIMQNGNVTPSRTMLDAVLGLKSGVAPGFWFNLFGGYKYTTDDYFFSPSLSWIGFGNMSSVILLNSKQLYGGLEMKYAYQRIFEATVRGIYSKWNVADGAASEGREQIDLVRPVPLPYGRPKMAVDAGLLVRPVAPLSLSLDYRILAGRNAHINWNEKMNDINELNFTAAYGINEMLGLYVKCNNILLQRYDVFYGYPMQGFNFMAGFNLNF